MARVADIRHLSVFHGEHTAVVDATFSLAGGEVVALRGPNGAGKSSLLLEIARPLQRGTVVIGGRDVHQLRRSERRRSVALVPEAFDDLLFATTVEQECRRADATGIVKGTAARFARLISAADAHDRSALMQRHPRDLSAGERLCLVIAIQLSARPTVLLVDEPSRGLDATARAFVGRALGEAAETGASVVIATHDREFVARHAHRTIELSAGHLVAGHLDVGPLDAGAGVTL